MMNKIYIAGDHVCYEIREKIIKAISEKYSNIDIENLGSFTNESVDYPDYAFKLSELVSKNKESIGIMTCGSGVGVSVCCNKVKGIRAGLVFNKEIARLSKQHNDCNVICLTTRFNSIQENIEIVLAFLEAQFEGGRHQKRIDKITKYEDE